MQLATIKKMRLIKLFLRSRDHSQTVCKQVISIFFGNCQATLTDGYIFCNKQISKGNVGPEPPYSESVTVLITWHSYGKYVVTLGTKKKNCYSFGLWFNCPLSKLAWYPGSHLIYINIFHQMVNFSLVESFLKLKLLVSFVPFILQQFHSVSDSSNQVRHQRLMFSYSYIRSPKTIDWYDIKRKKT